jgi:tetratricopeptide (TPR) repeat protein
MRRSVIVSSALAALVVAAVLVWVQVRQQREFRRLIATGESLLAKGQIVEASEAFSGAIAFRADSMLAHLRRGDTYRRRGDFAAALRDLRRAEGLDPTAPLPVELRGDVYAAMGRHQRAIEQYERYLALDERAPRVLHKLAFAHVQSGQPARAVEPLRKALALDDRLPEAHYLLGVTLRALKQDDAALQPLTRAVTLDTAFMAARGELADLYEHRGQWRESVNQLEAIAALDPDRPEPLIAVGLTYARVGRSEQAILTLSRAAERYPQSPAVYTALGRVWLESGEGGPGPVALSKAMEALAPVAARGDASSETLTLYGRALLLSGDAAASERILQQALTRRPVDPRAFRYLAETAGRLGHSAIARDASVRYALLAGSS